MDKVLELLRKNIETARLQGDYEFVHDLEFTIVLLVAAEHTKQNIENKKHTDDNVPF